MENKQYLKLFFDESFWTFGENRIDVCIWNWKTSGVEREREERLLMMMLLLVVESNGNLSLSND